MDLSRENKILLVDDNPTNLEVLFKTLEKLDAILLIARNGESALSTAKEMVPDVILLDIMMPGIDGYEVCRQLKNDPVTADSAIIFLSALVDVNDKVKGFDLGGVDYITKPFRAKEVIARVKSQLKICRLQHQIKHELKVAQELLQQIKKRLEGPLLGNSESIKYLRESITKKAKSSETLLLMGAPGSGEEVVARSIHEKSQRASHAFIYVNCSLADSTEEKKIYDNKFSLANGGTIYLDKINDLQQEGQEELCNILSKIEDSKNEEKTPFLDVRVIAFSPIDLADKVVQMCFMTKLYHLITKEKLHIPSLAERREDIPILADFYAQQYSSQLGKNIESISPESLEKMTSYSWPGNIQELKNFIECQVVLEKGSVLQVNDQTLGGNSLGNYNLIKKLGVGGMGEVWLGKHKLLDRPAAIKLVSLQEMLEVKEKNVLLKRFHREAKATAQLKSPHTIELYDYGVSKKGTFYYVMEYLEGLDLNSIVARFGPLSPERAVMFLQQACRSLIEAHQKGLVHRDIKPENLFISKLGAEYDFLKILDFGIVRYNEEEEDTKLTSPNKVIGSPSTFSPETLLGQKADNRSDLYSLGCVTHWMLTGSTVFKAKNLTEYIVSHASKIPEPPSQKSPFKIPEKLDQIVLKCLAKDPKERFSSASELWNELNQVEFENSWTRDRAEKWWQEKLPELYEQTLESSLNSSSEEKVSSEADLSLSTENYDEKNRGQEANQTSTHFVLDQELYFTRNSNQETLSKAPFSLKKGDTITQVMTIEYNKAKIEKDPFPIIYKDKLPKNVNIQKLTANGVHLTKGIHFDIKDNDLLIKNLDILGNLPQEGSVSIEYKMTLENPEVFKEKSTRKIRASSSQD